MSNPAGWENEGKELAGDIIGKGFVQWNEVGESLRGRVVRIWKTPAMKQSALVLELTELASAPIIDSTDPEKPITLSPGIGDAINIGLGHDLLAKLVEAPKGVEIGIVYSGEIPTKANPMRLFKVYNFNQETLPF